MAIDKSSTPSRRGFLALCGAATTGLAGCTITFDAGNQPTPDAETQAWRDAPLGTVRCDGELYEPTSEGVGAVTGSWPTSQYDAQNTGYSPDATGPADCPRTRWTAQLEEVGDREPGPTGSWQVAGMPVVGDGTLYMTDYAGRLYAFDPATGDREWVVHHNQGSTYGPTYADGLVYYSAAFQILAVDAETGEERWRAPTYGTRDRVNGFMTSSPTVADGTVYVATDNGVFQALDAATGEQRWQFDVFRPDPTAPSREGNYNHFSGSPAVFEDRVYAVNANKHLYAVNVATGEVRWTRELVFHLRDQPTVAHDTLFVTAQRDFYALDPGDGTTQWRLNEDGGKRITHASPAVDDTHAYVGQGHSLEELQMSALDVATGTITWGTPAVIRRYMHPSVAGGTVYIAISGAVLALDAETGAEQWRVKVDGGTYDAPVVVDDVLYLADMEGHLYAIA